MRFTRGRRLGQFAAFKDQRLECVGVIIVVHALKHGSNALEPHAGVDARFGQRNPVVRPALVILHEDQVPDFDKAVAVLVGTTRRPTGDVVAVIVKNLRTRPARPRITHRPEIIRSCDADDATVGQAGDRLP